jgi:hypothetical protein
VVCCAVQGALQAPGTSRFAMAKSALQLKPSIRPCPESKWHCKRTMATCPRQAGREEDHPHVCPVLRLSL